MAKVVVMPKLGLTMTEGTISKWFKKEGEMVKTGEALFEVETDKITNEIAATDDGVLLKIVVPEGEKAPVTEMVAVIGEDNEDISDMLRNDNFKCENKEDKIVINTAQTNKDTNIECIKATPYAKKIAKENNIDLKAIVGSGFEGRIIAKDVLMALEDLKIKISPVAQKIVTEKGIDVSKLKCEGRIMKEDVLNAAGIESKDQNTSINNDLEVEKIKLSTMRKVIAKRMQESWTTYPRVVYNMEVDVTILKEFRNKLAEEFKKVGCKLSYNHILMKIVSKALTEFPYLNAKLIDDEIILNKQVNIGLAVDVNGGLMVPNIKNVQSKSLLEIARETEEKIENVRSGSISPDDLQGGTFTISNLGMFDMDSFSPIINPPELAILGVNKMVDKPVVFNGEVTIRTMMNLSLVADHRVIDGAMAARFLKRIKSIIENPYLLLM